jgi:hypothetical protein
VGLRVGLDVAEKRKISRAFLESNPDLSATSRSLVSVPTEMDSIWDSRVLTAPF